MGILPGRALDITQKLVETISKDDIHSRNISDENVGDGDPDIGKRNFVQLFMSKKFTGGISSSFSHTQ